MVVPVVSRAPSSSPSSRVLPSLAVGFPTPQYNTVSSEPLLRNETGCEDENYGEGVTVSILLLVLALQPGRSCIHCSSLGMHPRRL